MLLSIALLRYKSIVLYTIYINNVAKNKSMHPRIFVGVLAVAVLVAVASPAHAATTAATVYKKVSPSPAVNAPGVRIATRGEVFTVKTISAASIGAINAKGKTFVIMITDGTTILNRASRMASLGEIRKGHRVRVMGTTSDANQPVITAATIVDESLAPKAVIKAAVKRAVQAVKKALTPKVPAAASSK